LPDERATTGNAEIVDAGGVRNPFTGVPWRARLLSAGFVLSDFLSVCIAYLMADWLYFTPLFEGMRRRSHYDPTAFLAMGLGMGLLLILSFGSLGLYSRGVSVLNVEEDVLLLKGLLFNAFAALALSFLLRDHPISRIALVSALVLTGPLVLLGRRFIRGLSAWFLSAGVGGIPVILYGAGDTGRQLADRLLRNPQFGLVPVGFVDDRKHGSEKAVRFGPGRRMELPLLGAGERVIEIMEKRQARLLLVAVPKLGSERLLQIQEACRSAGKNCYHVPLFAVGPLRRFDMTFVGDIPLVCERTSTSSLLGRAAKRTFDVVVSAFLLVGLSWIFLLVALLIKLTSKGPAFFAQERIGYGGRPFRMYKFRTMHTHAPAYARKPDSARHPAIYPLGRVLRRLSIDELPQLWNVLKGKMSLVGPRPEMPQIAKEYDTVQRERFLVLPGMTGLWQVSADRALPIHENVDYDLYYIYNQSLLLDLVILIRTALSFFRGH